MDTTRATFAWQGLSIEVLLTPSWSECYRHIYGYPLAHLQISAAGRTPLPISETGYRSHFERADNIAAAGGAVAYARAWLDQAARSPAWIEAQQEARQMSLF
ncbi:hypothetical protein ACFW0H_14935 [Pseudomonas sp. CR3202]|uniref:hypothetical protein n=1 Tax=Pseudomonas sp. CR3202 TaxID=3351532 RepID=UPI003BF0BC6A